MIELESEVSKDDAWRSVNCILIEFRFDPFVKNDFIAFSMYDILGAGKDQCLIFELN
jgi:hypothetical protein